MREKITAALKEATEAQDRRRLNTLRLICATIKDRDLAARSAGREGLSDEDVLEILKTMIRQRKESARGYEEGGRVDLAEEEFQEIGIIKALLPAQIDDTAMLSACAEAIESTNAHGLRDMGRCMAELKARYAGQMDFAKAIQIVKQRLQ